MMAAARMWSSALALALILGLLTSPLQAQVSRDIAKAMERLVVRVTPLDGPAVNRASSGLVVERTADTALAITALDATGDAGSFLIADSTGRTYHGRIVARDRISGVAVLSISGWTGPVSASPDDRPMRPGEQIVALGFDRVSGEQTFVQTRAVGTTRLANALPLGFEGGPVVSLAEQQVLGIARSAAGDVIPGSTVRAAIRGAVGAPPVAQPPPSLPSPTPTIPSTPTPRATPAPTSPPAVSLPAFEASIGTVDWSDGTWFGTAFFFRFRSSEAPLPREIVVRVRGPASWNEGREYHYTFRTESGQREYSGWHWNAGSEPLRSGDLSRCYCLATSGRYTLETVVDGKTQSVEVVVNARQSLAPPLQITTTDVSRAGISASWLPVAGAAEYFAQIREADASESVVASRSTREPRVSFVGLALNPARTYRVRVAAMNFALDSSLSGPLLQFNMSVRASAPFVPR